MPRKYIVANRSPITLFLAIVITPISGSALTLELGFRGINWFGISLLLWVRWIWELNYINNKDLKGEDHFDLRITNISYWLMSAIYALIAMKLLPLKSAMLPEWLMGALFIIHAIFAYYILWITARTCQLTILNREPTTLEVIGYWVHLTFYPLGIWTVHRPIHKLKAASNKR